jgi:hypothetical protein
MFWLKSNRIVYRSIQMFFYLYDLIPFDLEKIIFGYILPIFIFILFFFVRLIAFRSGMVARCNKCDAKKCENAKKKLLQ